MAFFQVEVLCHQLARQKGSKLLVSSKQQAITIMKYADHARISSILRGFFGDVQVLDGAHTEYTDVNVTRDHTGTVWSLPDLPSLRSIEDIADSILACYQVQVCHRLCACTLDDNIVTA
jgi:hypothetical protein